MRKIKLPMLLFLLLLGIVFVASLVIKNSSSSSPRSSSQKKLDISQIVIENVIFNIELAQTPKERSRGLSGREKLCPQCGMLFVFENDDYHSFWMKETLIPLDIIWLDKNWQVVDFVGFAQPQGTRTDEELPIYQSQKLARYVLEVSGGTTKKIKDFRIGSKVSKK